MFGNKNSWLVCFQPQQSICYQICYSTKNKYKTGHNIWGNYVQEMNNRQCRSEISEGREIWRPHDGPRFCLGTLSCPNTRGTSPSRAAGINRPNIWAPNFWDLTWVPWSRARLFESLWSLAEITYYRAEMFGSAGRESLEFLLIMDWTFVSPQNSDNQDSTYSVAVFGDWAFI